MTYTEDEIEILKRYLPLRYNDLSEIADSIQNILSKYLLNRDEEGRDIEVYNIYSIRSRVKSPQSLIEKIRGKNKEGKIQIKSDNYDNFIEDLIGARIVCYHPSDLPAIKALIKGLKFQEIIDFEDQTNPFVPQSPFILPTVPQEVFDVDVKKTKGYSSIHSIVRLKKCPKYKIELQLRTLLEETWGEISHFHQYKQNASSALKQGFYVLSALLGACNLEVDYLKFEAKDKARPKEESEEEKDRKNKTIKDNFDKPLMDILRSSQVKPHNLRCIPDIRFLKKGADSLWCALERS